MRDAAAAPTPAPSRATARHRTRDAEAAPVQTGTRRRVPTGAEGKRYIVSIGIDRYGDWPVLRNAVNDAEGAQQAFEKLGFEPLREPLLNDAATGAALRQLAAGDLRRLAPHDSLVVFFAGHGHTQKTVFHDDSYIERGFLIPADAKRAGSKQDATWLASDAWLSEVSLSPAKHILVILDACHSGIAIHSLRRTRDAGPADDEHRRKLEAHLSRRAITSAFKNEVADDSGPLHRHSVFTGTLIQALEGDVFRALETTAVSSQELAAYVQGRVLQRTRGKQTPEFGPLVHNDHGDLVLTQRTSKRGPPPRPSKEQEPSPRLPCAPVVKPRPKIPRRLPDSTLLGKPVPGLDPHLVGGLDLHEEARRRAAAISVLCGADESGAATWARWAAHRDYSPVLTTATSVDAAVGHLLSSFPWLRTIIGARAHFAAAAGIPADSIGVALDARSGGRQSEWLDRIADGDPIVRVSGWLLSSLRDPAQRAPDLAAAPLEGGLLLSALAELAPPLAVGVHVELDDDERLARALATASALTAFLPRHAVAVSAPRPPSERVLARSQALGAGPNVRRLIAPIPAAPTPALALVTRTAAATALAHQLAHARALPPFHQRVSVRASPGEAPVIVDLAPRNAQLAICIDDWHHASSPWKFRTRVHDDAALARAGLRVLRFLPEEIERHPRAVVDDITIALGACRAS